ncbi:MAG: hypothetical protein IMY86_11245, partial [Chloroflexi bacterium]|nr:hypothetical protein [Chloroflexota bacterium]
CALPYALPLVQLILALVFLLYPLTYTNPLAGGPWVAARVISVDWGEGMGAAARWLNQLPDADQLTVAAASVPTFASLFKGHTVPLDQATLADYVVDFDTPTPTYPPVHTVTHGSIDLATIYTNTAPFEQAVYLSTRARPDDLILLDADTPLRRCYAGPGALVAITDLPYPTAVADRLAELSAGRSRLWLVADPSSSPITAAYLRQGIESIADPIFTTTLASATITQYAIRSTQHATRTAQYANFNQLVLIDALLPPTPVNVPFPVFLRWQVSTPTPTNLHGSLYLQDAGGHLWTEAGQLVLNSVTFPTSAWAPGEWADDTLTLRLPEHIPPGTYAVRLTVTDAEGAQLGAWDDDGKFQGVRISLGEVEIATPTEPAEPAVCAEGRAITTGPFLACIPELPQQAIPSGDTLALAITWSATAPPRADYTVRWRLQDSAGSVAMEQIVALSPHATSHWREGDSFEARYDLRFDPTLPAGTYTLALNVLTPDGCPLWTRDEILATIEILPRERIFDLPSGIAYSLDLT